MFRRFLIRVAACACFGVLMSGCAVLMGMDPVTVAIYGACWFGAAMFTVSE